MRSAADLGPRALAGARARRSAGRLLGLLTFALAAAAGGCVSGPDVDYTVPADGATGVEPATEIVVGFTSELDPETGTEVANFVVFGSSSGTIATTASLDETGRVLTIAPAAPFLSGERVTISLTSRMTTAISIPLDEYQFSFRIRGTAAEPEDFDPAQDQFLLTDLDPESGTAGLAQRPLVRADFDRNVLASSIAGHVALRGSATGRREAIASGAELQGTGTAQTAAQVLVQLAPAETPFEPGERVTIAYTESITSPATGGGTASTLRPFVATYEVRGGLVGGGFSEALPLTLAAGTDIPAAAHLEFGDLLQFEGPELAILDVTGTIRVLRRDPSGAHVLMSSFQTELPAAMRLADVDDDGLLEIVVATRTGLLEVLQLIGGNLVRAHEAVEIPGGEPHDLEVADLDGDGDLDIAVGVAEGLQFFEQIAPTGLPPIPGLPVVEGFVAVTGDPLVDPVSELEVGELDGDGRPDIVARTAGGTTVLRNAGEFLFAEVSVLTVEPIPGTIQIVDFDGDGRQEIVTGGLGGAFVHPNAGTGIPAPTWGAVTVPLGATPSRIVVTNIDGDAAHLPDLVAYSPGAVEPLVLHLRRSSSLADLEATPVPVSGTAPTGGIALADVDRDGARDLLLYGAGGGVGRLLLSRSEGVIDAGDPTFAFALAGPSSVDLGNEVNIALSADLGEDITRFSVAMSWHDSFTLQGVTLDPVTFPGGSVSPDVETGSGAGSITVDLGGAVLPEGDTLPLLSLRFKQTQPQPGDFAFTIVDEVDISDTVTGRTELVLESEGIAFPDLSSGSVTVAMSSSVPAVTGLACSSTGGGVQLAWSNPESYSQIRIRRNGIFLSTLGGAATGFLDESPLSGGTVVYQVIGVQGSVESLPAVCEVSLFGQLTCTRLEATPTRIRLTWQTGGGYQTISILRDGNLVGVVSGTQTAYTDETGDLNGHSYSVYGTADGVDSTPATCPQGEVPDAAGGLGILDPVTQVLLAIEQGIATVTWQNGESYDQVLVRRNGIDLATLPGGASQFVDPDLLPSIYQYSIRGDADGLTGVYVPSNTVSSDLPHPTGLTCTLAGGNQIQLAWTNGPESYGYEQVLVERTDTGAQGSTPEVIAELPGGSTAYLDTNIPDGTYSYRVIGTYGPLQAPSSSCDASLQNLFRVADLVTTPGMDAVIEIDGQFLAAASGYSLSLRYDSDRITLTGLALLGTPAPLPAPSAPDANGFRTVALSLSGVSIDPGFGVPLARIAVATAESFAAVGASPLDLVEAEIELAAGGSLDPAIADGVLDVEPFGLFFEPAEVLPGGILEGWIFGTFSSPISGYTLSIQFDPELLTLVEITEQGTVGEEIDALVFSSFDNAAGFASLAQILLGSTGLVTLSPQIAEPLAFVRFLVDPAADPGETSIAFADWVRPGDLPDFENAFVDEDAQSIEPVGFAGAVTILEPTVPPTIDGVDPASGPAAGGATVLVTGSGFLADLAVSFGGAPVSPAQILVLSSEEALVVTPPGAPGPVAVTVATSLGDDTLAAGYTYIGLTVASAVPSSVNPCVEAPIVLHGTGFSPDLQVRIGDVYALVLDVGPDGTTAEVMPPAFSLASPTGTAVVPVTVEIPGSGGSAALPGGLSYVVTEFIRGDVNGDGDVNAADVAFLGSALAGTGPLPANFDAADVNDDGLVHIGDLVALSDWLFQAGASPPAAPFPGPGLDPTPDGICP